MVGDHRLSQQKNWAGAHLASDPSVYARPGRVFKPNPINVHTDGSISQALGCQMGYGITLAGWRKRSPPKVTLQSFSSAEPFKSRFRLVQDVEQEGLIHPPALFCFQKLVWLVQSSLIYDQLLLIEFVMDTVYFVSIFVIELWPTLNFQAVWAALWSSAFWILCDSVWVSVNKCVY